MNIEVRFMFSQTDSLREFCFRGSNYYSELRIFVLRLGLYVFFYFVEEKNPSI